MKTRTRRKTAACILTGVLLISAFCMAGCGSGQSQETETQAGSIEEDIEALGDSINSAEDVENIANGDMTDEQEEAMQSVADDLSDINDAISGN